MRGKYSQHTEWLSLVEVSGPFLAIPVLEKIFPQGLDAVDTSRRKYIRDVYDYRCGKIDEGHAEAIELNKGWARIVLEEILDFDDSILLPVDNDEAPELVYKSPDCNGVYVPDLVLRSEAGEIAFLLVSILPPGTDLEKVKTGDEWPVSIIERMTLLCRTTGVRLGLVTDGERWVLVNAPVGGTSGHTSWYARLWFQEPVTLQAFKSLLETRRWFGPDDESLSAMLEASLEHLEEVTDTLGEQVRRAVEVLVQCLDRADQDRNRELLRNVQPAELYEAGLTVMMRLVFILCAEERGLLLLDDNTYASCYAISTLRSQLSEKSHRHGPELLERHHDAWARLLAVFRAVFGGIDQEDLHMPALGGSLFNPDRFPFLEGRAKETHWQETPAQPLPIDNRTVLLLLEALQVLEQRGGALLLSYKALDVEQIGHVYEGLLEHTVQRLPGDNVGLIGSKKAKNPNVGLAELESAYLDGIEEAAKLVKSITLRGLPAIRNALNKEVDDDTYSKVLAVCGGDTDLANRIRPFSHLLRTDAWGDFIVYRKGSFSVTLGTDRRETGTHYTPKSLTESIVETTLEPLAYVGPADGKARDKWQLKSSAELLELKICDPAMGSGAFLVQVCRWLSERLVEAWGKEAAAGKFITMDGLSLDVAGSAEPMLDSLDERLLLARRLVAEKCLYGVDMNPLAVELSKLSIWLITLAKGRPFGFLDHNIRSGDSLLGLYKMEQLTKFSLQPKKKQTVSIFASNIEEAVRDALSLRKKLREIPIRDINDVQYMEQLDQEARQKLEHIENIADAMIGESLAAGGNERLLGTAMENLSAWAAAYIEGDNETGGKIITEAIKSLSIDQPSDNQPRKPFHWVLEFPEVFEHGGFDGIIGNPPFQGGKKITGSLGTSYRTILVKYLADGAKGHADLCAYFFLRAGELLRHRGNLGLLATNTIAQGDTREVGLDQMTNQNFIIYRAISSCKWPGSANIEIAHVWMHKGKWQGAYVLEDESVKGITPNLTIKGKVSGKPYRLKANEEISSIGSYILGMGFVLTPEDAYALIDKDPKNKNVLFPYLNGKDLNSRPDQSPSRWVINFFDWPLKRIVSGSWANSSEKKKRGYLQKGIVPPDYPDPVAADYAQCLNIIEEKVKPSRSNLKRKAYREKWWRYAERQPKLQRSIANMKRILTVTLVSKHLVYAWQPVDYVYSHALGVICTDRDSIFSILQSNIHYIWSLFCGSTLETRMRYTPTDCCETFPFPNELNKMDDLGRNYYQHRKQIMINNNEGLTATYNKFHNINIKTNDILHMRDLHSQIDYAVSNSFGWNDLNLEHGFHETPQGIRFTVSQKARSEILDRLLALNHERYKEEVEQGLHDKKNNKRKSGRNTKKKHVIKGPKQLSLLR